MEFMLTCATLMTHKHKGQSLVIAISVLIHNYIQLQAGVREHQNHLLSIVLLLPFAGVTAGLLYYNWCVSFRVDAGFCARAKLPLFIPACIFFSRFVLFCCASEIFGCFPLSVRVLFFFLVLALVLLGMANADGAVG